MRRHHLGVARGLAAAACAAALAACSSGGSSTGNKNSSLPPQAVQTEIAASVATSITTQIEAMGSTNVTAFAGLFNRVSSGNGQKPVVNLAKLLANPATHAREGTDCPAITGSLTDTDGDGIPDNITETWGSDCSISGGGETTTITGSITIADATPDTPGLAYNASIDNLSIADVGSSITATVGLNGSLAVTETLSSIGVNANYTFGFTESAPNALTESVVEKLNSTYTFPATSQLLTEADIATNGLPAGTFNISGSDQFSVNNNTYAFTVSTPTPLTVDPVNCPSAVTAGVVTVGFSGQGATGTATITWSGCNVYTVTDN